MTQILLKRKQCSTSNLKICHYKLTRCVRIPLDVKSFLLYMVYHSREISNINLPTAHHDKNHIDRDTKVEGYDAHACWKQNKTINNGDKAVHTQSRIFKLRVLLSLCAIINFWGVTPRPFKCRVLRWWAMDFSFEFIKSLQNNFSKQRYITLNASIPG